MRDMIKKVSLLFMVLLLLIPANIPNYGIAVAAGGSGTVADPIIVSTPEEFNDIRNNLSLHYKLDSDIDLSSFTNWTPIGGTFLGGLDGSGHVITGLSNSTHTTYRGLFHTLGNNSYVKNLVIEDADMVGTTNSGILAGRTLGNASNKVIIENLSVSGTITSNSGNGLGGLVGLSNYTDYSDLRTNIKINSLNNPNYVGGIVGQSNFDSLKDSVLKGDIVSTTTNATAPSQYGGVFGYTNTSNIENVRSSVNLSNTFTTSATQTSVDWGGIIGQSNSGIIKNVVNNGYIHMGTTNSGSKYSNNIGGILGTSNSTYLESVINKGEIDVAYVVQGTTTYASNGVGGLVGYSNNVNIKDSVNYGDVKFKSGIGWTTVYNYGGIIGNGNGSNGSIVRGALNTLTISNTVNHGDVLVEQDSQIYNIGGFAGTLNYPRVDDSYSTGNVIVSYANNINNRSNYNVGGFVGYFLDGTNSTGITYPNINRVYSSGDVINHNGGSTGQWVSGLASYKRGVITSSFYVGNTVNDTFADNIAYRFGLFHSNSYLSNDNYYNSDQEYPVTAVGSAGTKTEAELKTFTPYSDVGWSSSDWGIEPGVSFPYLKSLYASVEPESNLKSFQSGTVKLKYKSDLTGNERPVKYQVIIEEKRPDSENYTEVSGSFTGTVHSGYDFKIPAGTPGNTDFRWKVRGQNAKGVWSEYSHDWTEFLFANNVSKVDVTFDNSNSNFTSNLDNRLMEFSVDSIIDPDEFSYINLYVEVEGVAGSKQKIVLPENVDTSGIVKDPSLTGGLSGPLVDYPKLNYILKYVPNYSMPDNDYNLVVVDSLDESRILATLIKNRSAQSIKDSTPDDFIFKVYVEDSQKEIGTKLATSTEKKTEVSIDSRNKVPVLSDMTNDVNGRTMSVNQGFNKINITGKVTDIDPSDDLEVYYTVRSQSESSLGVHDLDPATDVKVSEFKSSDYTVGVKEGKFEATYTVSDFLENGAYDLVVYSLDHRGGFSIQHIIEFDIDKTNPDIKFFAEYGGNVISTPERQVVPKDSKFKMYFSAYDYITFEYAGYLVRSDQQKEGGTYEDLKIRGAFTNDVKSSFVGLDLMDSNFVKGDMIVFKFKAVSATGVTIEKDIRVIIGDEQSLLSKLENQYLPTDLR